MSTHPSLRIALSGGIACGKSAVAARFKTLGVPVIDLDEIAREVVAPDSLTLQQLVTAFGPEIRHPDGTLNRVHLRERIFNSTNERKRLEAIMHPAIRAQQSQLAAQLNGPYQIHVVPLLIETATTDDYDRVLIVDCPPELQLQRLQTRDGIDLDLAKRMLAAQANRTQRLHVADDVIDNTDSLTALEHKVDQLHAQYLVCARHPT